MSKNLFITLPWDKSYTLLVSPVSGRFAVDQNHVGYELRPATTEALGGVIVGDNLVVTDAGRLSATGSGVAGVSSFNNRVGKVDLTDKDVSDALGFRPVQYKLPVATEQILGGVKQGKNVTIAADGSISVPDTPTPYSLPIASANTLGGIKIGKNLTVHPDGTVDAEGGSTITGVTTFNGRKGDVKLTKKDVTDVVIIPDPYDLPVASEKTLGGIKVGYNLEVLKDGTLNAIDQKYSLPPATTKDLGGIIVGDNLTIDAQGRLSATGGEGSGVISFNGRMGRVNLTSKDVAEVQNIASKSSLGVIKVGKNLIINPDGTLDANSDGVAGVQSFNKRTGAVSLETQDILDVAPIAQKNQLGLIKVGNNLTIHPDGTLEANGGAIAGVSSFQGRTGDVKMQQSDLDSIDLQGTDENYGVWKIDDESICLNDDGQLCVDEEALDVVKTFNGRTQDVTLQESDVRAVAFPANRSELGMVKVGSGLSVSADGTISASGDDIGSTDAYKLWDIGKPFVTPNSSLVIATPEVTIKKALPCKTVYVGFARVMDTFYTPNDLVVLTLNMGKTKLQSYYDLSDVDVGVDCFDYGVGYFTLVSKDIMTVETEYMTIKFNVTRLKDDLSLGKLNRIAFSVAPSASATDTGETVIFSNIVDPEVDSQGRIWKKNNLIGHQILTMHKNHLFTYDYRLHKNNGGVCVFNYDVPLNSFSAFKWEKTVVFRDISTAETQTAHNIVLNINAKNADVVSPFNVQVNGDVASVTIPYAAKGGDRVVVIESYNGTITVTGDTMTRNVTNLPSAYKPYGAAFYTFDNPQTAPIYVCISQITTPFDRIKEWRVQGDNAGKKFDRIVPAPQKVTIAGVSRDAILLFSMDTEIPQSGDINCCIITTDMNGVVRKSAYAKTTVKQAIKPAKPTITNIYVSTDDKGDPIVRFEFKNFDTSTSTMLIQYKVTNAGKTTTYLYRESNKATLDKGQITLSKSNGNSVPSGHWVMSVTAVTTVAVGDAEIREFDVM